MCSSDLYIQWYSTRRFRNFLLFTSSEDPLLSNPTHCRRAAVSRIPVVSISRPTAQTLSRHSSNNDVVSGKLYCKAYGERELHDYWYLPPYIPSGGVFQARGKYDSCFCREMQQVDIVPATPCRSVPPGKRSGFISIKSS